jgi:DNA invertase Pin-like site-specific DNA recombinase
MARMGAMRGTAFGYLRLSKWDEASTSPQRQRAAIKRWCTDRDLALVQIFEDIDVSAYRRGARRPGLEAMLARLGEVDHVVTLRLDRLARSVSGFAKLIEQFETAGVKFSTTDGAVDMSTAAGRAVAQLISVFAELEASTTSERARAMHAYKRERGEHVGRVPFGWRREGKTIAVDPDTFAVIEKAARRYVAGESMRTVAADVGLQHPNLSRVLRTDRVIDALPPTLGARLVEELAERGRTGGRAKLSLLGGIARCGRCGGPMTVIATRGVGRKPWSSYSCKERDHVSISRPFLDQYVSDAVLEAIDTGKLLKRLDRRKRPTNVRAASELEARLELLERDHYERGLVARDSYLRRREGILKRLGAAKAAEVDSGIDLPRELALHLSERWPDLSIPGRRRIIGAVLRGITIERAKSHGRVDQSRVKLGWR